MPRTSRVAPVLVLVLVLAVGLLAGCSDDGGQSSSEPTTRQDGTKKDKARKGKDGKTKAAAGEDADEQKLKICGEHTEAQTRARPSAKARTIADASGDRPRIRAVVYPRPDYEGRPWSQWGQGVVAGGMFWSAVGDHCGQDGNSYFYRFDPATDELDLVADVNSIADHQPGAWGYGKIHGALVRGADGGVYAATYWGSSRGLVYGKGYQGDLLLRLDPGSGALQKVALPVPEHGIPSLAATPDGTVLFGEATDPAAPKTGPFFAYDVEAGKVVYTSGSAPHDGFRSVMVDATGRAYWSAGDGGLRRYDPRSGRAEAVDAKVPGDTVRAATAPAPDGTVYGVTKKPPTFFALSSKGEVRRLGAAKGYTTSLALSKDGRYVYSVPAAHGSSNETGTPLVRLDTRTGEQHVVVQLNPPAEEELKLTLGGTYDVVMDPSGERLYIGCNANEVGAEDTFGIPVLLVVDLAG